MRRGREPNPARVSRSPHAAVEPSRGRRAAVFILFFVSGATGLVYEVLWMKGLSVVFGNTAQAAATTLSVFFSGLLLGAVAWGRRASRLARPLRAYAALEGAVAASALLFLLLIGLERAVYGMLFDLAAPHPGVLTLVRIALSVAVLLPPAFFMGGTLPVMSQYVVRSPARLGRIGAALYGVNTIGAAAGATAAAFALLPSLGQRGTTGVAVATTAAVALAAWRLDRHEPRQASRPAECAVPASEPPSVPAWSTPRALPALAFFSGLGTLAMEVLWTRMFAQVFQNSVYSFAAVLVTFLAALGCGAFAARRLVVLRADPRALLAVLLTAAAMLLGATPFAFHAWTDGLVYLGGDRDFAGYLVHIFASSVVVMFVPGVLMGGVFPLLLRVVDPSGRGVGRVVGDLVATNTAGAIAGALVAGFVLPRLVGLWASVRLLAIAYAGIGFVVATGSIRGVRSLRAAAAAAAAALLTVADPARLAIVDVDDAGGESVLRLWEDGSSVVAVVRRGEALSIKMDNDYTLGGTGAAVEEERQAHLPLLLHPDPRAVFFLGMGTGITAGAALLHPVDRVVVTELVPQVVEAARGFFTPAVHGLFDDARARVVAEDGRTHLHASRASYDLVIADLFMPWKAGVGALYTRDHYAVARGRLRRDGLYVQWLPLYQISEQEFGIIARTMRDAFPLVTLWRGSFDVGAETAALVGHARAAPLDRSAVLRRLEQQWRALGGSPDGRIDAGSSLAAITDPLLHYCGNITTSGSLLDGYPVNTDDRSVIEYVAPVTHRRMRAGRATAFVGGPWLDFLERLLRAAPLDRDPFLRELAPVERDLVRAGHALYLARVLELAGDVEGATAARRFFARMTDRRGDGT